MGYVLAFIVVVWLDTFSDFWYISSILGIVSVVLAVKIKRRWLKVFFIILAFLFLFPLLFIGQTLRFGLTL